MPSAQDAVCGAPQVFQHVHDVEHDRDLHASLARTAQHALDLITLTIDEHDPAPRPLGVPAQALGEGLVDHMLAHTRLLIGRGRVALTRVVQAVQQSATVVGLAVIIGTRTRTRPARDRSGQCFRRQLARIDQVSVAREDPHPFEFGSDGIRYGLAAVPLHLAALHSARRTTDQAKCAGFRDRGVVERIVSRGWIPHSATWGIRPLGRNSRRSRVSKLTACGPSRFG